MLDPIDRRLLQALQSDATLTAQELGERLNLSGSQAGRRRQRLEATGYITATRAMIDPARVGLGVQAFVQVQMSAHSRENHESFARLVHAQTAVTAAFTLTGEADYLLRTWCEDLQALHHLINGILLPHPAVARVQSQIVMDQMKPDAPLPL